MWLYGTSLRILSINLLLNLPSKTACIYCWIRHGVMQYYLYSCHGEAVETSGTTLFLTAAVQYISQYSSRHIIDFWLIMDAKKSTLINLIVPGASQRTAEISCVHDTGMHTTTFSEMLSLPQGGYVIDTPGIKGFGTFDMEPEESPAIAKYVNEKQREKLQAARQSRTMPLIKKD